MMSKRLVIAALAALVVAGGCAQRGDRAAGEPDWVAGNPADYPPERYLIGRGAGASPARARDRARADLAKVFAVRIQAETRDVQVYRSGGGDESAYGELDVERRLATRTDEIVSGARIAEQWQDPDSGTHHALAVLERARAVQRLREQIRGLDRATRAHIERARSEGDLLARIEAATRAVAQQRQRRHLQSKLRAIDADGRGVTPKWSLDRLVADRDALRERLRVRVETTGGDPARLARVARTVLGEAGVSVTAEGPYRLRVALDTEALGPRNGWHWRIGRLSVELVDPAGTTRGGRRWPIKVAASEPELAERRVYDRVAERLETGLAQALVGIDAAAAEGDS